MTREKIERTYYCLDCNREIKSCFDVRITCKCGKQMIEKNVKSEKSLERKPTIAT